jgi:hypothetical protein
MEPSVAELLAFIFYVQGSWVRKSKY